MSVGSGGHPRHFIHNYNIFVIDNKHANQGSQCSSVPTYTLVVQNIALYRLQDNFACLISTFFCGVQCSVVSLIRPDHSCVATGSEQ